MSLTLYDTMARAKRPFVPADPRQVTMYVCGPTVYNYSHIGNFRPVVVFDVLFRVLRELYGAGAVRYAANVTDVDDKINAKAQAEGVPIATITDRYLAAYNADAASLGALPPTVQPRATETMDAIIAMIGRLVANGSAYPAEGHVLFNTQSFADYGKLSGRPLDEMIAGARVEVAPYKQHPADFVLWKPSKPGEPEWESPWGAGRPGWHIECSAMIEQELGLPIDIHGGGIDLVFPHHENELAQGMCDHAEGEHHESYARYWLHNGFLNMADEKMSKSLGNVSLAHDLLETHPGEAIRWALLGAQYRQPLAWTEDALSQARNSLDHLYGVLGRARHIEAGGSGSLLEDQLEPVLDDLNTPAAMAQLKKLANDLDAAVRKGAPTAPAIKQDLMALASVMGVLQADPQAWFQGGADEDLTARIEGLIAARDLARVSKDWGEADRIRAELTALNVEVMDGPAGGDLADQGAGLMPIGPTPQLKSGLFARGTGALKPVAAKPKGPPPPKGPSGVRIEHRVGIQAPETVIWDILADLPAWGGWCKLYPQASGVIRIGSTLDITLQLGDQAPQQIKPTVMEWVPNEQLHWRLTMLGGLVTTIRYFEIETLATGACIVSNGEIIGGLLGPSGAKRMGRTIYRAFVEMNEALKARAEATWQAQQG